MTKILVQILSLLFGIGSWIAITGLWLEIPVLINHLPEKWSLASDMNLVIQLANIGPIVYFLCKRIKFVNQTNASHLLLAIGLLSCLILITGWNKTTQVFGRERSIVLLVATFGLALLDCTSSVTCLPFMGRFHTKYLTAYLIGEGLSGFIPTIFAIIQDVDPMESCEQNIHNISSNSSSDNTVIQTELRFSAEIFFASLLVTLLISWSALVLLQILPICKRESRLQIISSKIYKNSESTIKLKGESLEGSYSIEGTKTKYENQESKPHKSSLISRSKYYYLLCLIFLCCLSTFGFMPSIQPYSALPYGNSTLHYVVILSGLSYPFGCFLAMLIHKHMSMKKINSLIVFGHIIATYIITCALLSPGASLISSVKQNIFLGSFAIIFAWILFTISLSYSKTLITLIISEHKGDDGLFWVGFHTQLGAFLGATLMFVLVNYTNIFQEPQC